MSFLQDQINAFKSSANQASIKIDNKRTTAAPKTLTPSTATLQPPALNQNDRKRKQPEQVKIVYSQPANTGTGTNINTQITLAVEQLKNKGIPQTLTDIINYLSLHNAARQYKQSIGTILMSHPKVEYNPKSDGGEALFRYRPPHNIRSQDQIVGHLQAQHTFKGLGVKELKDGWPGAEDAIDDLEIENKLLVTRNKKDNHAKMVWPNDPSLAFEIDEEFLNMWHKVKLPEPGAVADELEREGLLPANKSRGVKKMIAAPTKKTKKPRKGGKTTNTHMQGVLRDYSHLKK
ncbi:transcription initiation factor TFIIE subunit beta, partial [Lecanoromycetidae sp. Uapishka_2]